MTTIDMFHVLVGIWLFTLGTVVGSFLNVCIYRIPWQKSVIWPASHCPKCLQPIRAWDNVPVLSWFILRGRCRCCGSTISPRYAFIEFVVGLLFVAVFLTDVAWGRGGIYGFEPYFRMLYHLMLVCLLVAATFIDYDLWIIPDEITVPGMLLGVIIGAMCPEVRPEPATAHTHWDGLIIGATGLAMGAGLTWGVGFLFTTILRKDAMGFGDVTLMGLIGSVMGWRAAILVFFAGAYFGLAHAVWKITIKIRKWACRVPRTSADSELPYGPYLSMAAVTLLLWWPWFWPRWGKSMFEAIPLVFWYLIARNFGADMPPGP